MSTQALLLNPDIINTDFKSIDIREKIEKEGGVLLWNCTKSRLITDVFFFFNLFMADTNRLICYSRNEKCTIWVSLALSLYLSISLFLSQKSLFQFLTYLGDINDRLYKLINIVRQTEKYPQD